MCLIVLTPTQVVEGIKRSLSEANKSLADAQKDVADALSTIDMVVDDFRSGRYKEKEKSDFGVTITTTPVGGFNEAGLCQCGLDVFHAPEQHEDMCSESTKSRAKERLVEEAAWAESHKQGCTCGK